MTMFCYKLSRLTVWEMSRMCMLTYITHTDRRDRIQSVLNTASNSKCFWTWSCIYRWKLFHNSRIVFLICGQNIRSYFLLCIGSLYLRFFQMAEYLPSLQNISLLLTCKIWRNWYWSKMSGFYKHCRFESKHNL